MLLHAVSPPIRNADVDTLQRRLQKLGMQPGLIDGKYGSTTAAAVERFQRLYDPEFSLSDPGVCNDVLFTRIEAALAENDVRMPSDSRLGQDAVKVAATFLNVKENPPFSNMTQFGEWFGVNGVKWCSIFVSYCFAHSPSKYIICDGVKGAGVKKGKGCSYVPTVEAWLRSSGFWVGRATPRPGDIFIFKGSHHIGLVESVSLKNPSMFVTIEGNTSTHSDNDGGEVQRRSRSLEKAAGFGRIHSKDIYF